MPLGGFTNDLALLFHIRSDSSQAKADISGFRGAVQKETQAVVQDFAGMTGGAGRLASALGPVGLGFAAVTGAVIAGVSAFGAYVSKAVEMGSHLHDLSLETGLSVETLSGLEGQLKQSGAQVDDLSNLVFLLHKNLGSAAEGNKEFKRTFEQLGIKDVDAALRDTEGTLRTVLKSLGQLTDEGVRDRLGAEAMGKAYKNLRVFIADTGGDIEEVIRKAKESGEVVSDIAANNLDELGDKWDEVHHKADVFTTNFVGIMAPELTKALDDISVALTGNLTSWEDWALGAAIEVARVRGALEGMANWWRGDTWSPWELGKQVEQGADAAELGAAITYVENKLNPPKPKPSSGGGGLGARRGGGRGGKDKAAAGRLKDIQLDEKEFDTDFRRESDALERDYRRRLDNLDQYVEGELSLLETWIAGKREIFDREETELRRSTKNADERERKLRELNEKRVAASDEYDRKRNALEDKREEEQRRASEARADALLDVDKAVAQQRIATIEHVTELGIKRESDAAKEIGDIQLASQDRAAQRLKERLANEKEGSAEYRQIQGEIAVMEVERATLAEEVAYRIEVAKKREVEAERDRLRELRRLREDAEAEGLEIRRAEITGAARDDVYQTRGERRATIRALADADRALEEARHKANEKALEDFRDDMLRRAKTEAERVEALTIYHKRVENEYRRHQQKLGEIQAGQKAAEEALDPLRSLKKIWEDFKNNVENANDSIANSVESMADRVVDSLQNMEGALRQGIVAHYLYGESLGVALKKALAEQLAEISAECWVQGIKHSAYALGSLAFGNFGAAAKHAAAAGAFFAAAAATGKGASALAKSAGLRGMSSGTSAGSAVASTAEPTPRNQTFNYGGNYTEPSSADARGNFWGRVEAKLDAMHRQQMTMQAQTVAAVNANTQALAPFRTASPGDVVERGIDERPHAVGNGVKEWMNRGGHFDADTLGDLGFRR